MSSPHDIWSASDYAPTAARLRPAAQAVAAELRNMVSAPAHVVDIGAGHGDGVEPLLEHGYSVSAIEPTECMRSIGQERAPGAAWIDAYGERTGLADNSADAITSSFGAMFCDPAAGPAEWARILKPGGVLLMTVWNQQGFLATMTDAMMEAVNPGNSQLPPHMAWGIDEIAHERLAGGFDDIAVQHRELDWSFDSIEQGMELYLEGSPTHAWMLGNAGPRREPLLAALREHLEAHAGNDDRIKSTTGYALISARRR